MTGRELIIYISENKLEDEPVIKDGKFIGFLTPLEVAAQMNVGVATVEALIALERLSGERVKPGFYIPARHPLSADMV